MLRIEKRGSLHGFYLTVLRKSFYIHWSAGRSPWVHEVNPGRDPSTWYQSQVSILGPVGYGPTKDASHWTKDPRSWVRISGEAKGTQWE